MKLLFCKLLSNVGFFITVIYCIFNVTAIILIEPELWDKAQWLTDIVLGIDVFTWHIFGIFSIFTFIMKLWLNTKSVEDKANKNLFDVQSILHLLFMAVSFIGIYYIFENSF